MEDIISVFSWKRGWRISDDEDYDGCGYGSTFCFACHDSVRHTSTYSLDYVMGYGYTLHKSCASLPGKIQHPLHPQHPLIVQHYPSFFICHGCSNVSMGLRYHCGACKFKLDLQCGSKIEGKIWKKKVETYSLYHLHKLRVVYNDPFRLFDGKSCCCCGKGYRKPAYACTTCIRKNRPFFIHKFCVDSLPQTVQSSFHPQHPLSIQPWKEFFDCPYCAACRSQIERIAFTCKKCDLRFHIYCGNRARAGLRLDSVHRHDMHYVRNFDERKNCSVCEAETRNDAVYRCVKCDMNVHLHCIPISRIVEHESHHHPLEITSSIVTHRESGEYRCDICEEIGDVQDHSYYCQECDYIAHIECVYSDLQVIFVLFIYLFILLLYFKNNISMLLFINQGEIPLKIALDSKGKSEAEELKKNDSGEINRKGKGKVRESTGVVVDEKIRYALRGQKSGCPDELNSESDSSVDDDVENEESQVRSAILEIRRKIRGLIKGFKNDGELDRRMRKFLALVLRLEDLRSKRTCAGNQEEDWGFNPSF